MRNKRGAIGIIAFFIILFVILMVGVIASVIVGLIDFAGDEITPVIEDLGVVSQTGSQGNLSAYTTVAFGTANQVIQGLPWLVGFAFVAMLIFSIIFAISYPINPNPIFMVLYVALVILLVMGTILISNIYEEIYEGTDDLATRLQEQTMLSYMILYSPFILTLIAFITGIFVFARNEGAPGI